MMKYLLTLAFVMLYVSPFSVSAENSLAAENQAVKTDAELKQLRNKIDVINREILALLNERAQVVLEIGELKARNSMEIYDPAREKEIEDKLAQINAGPLSDDAVIKIFREIISACRDLQQTK
jgi:chorismate mutase-like protein